MAIRIETVQTNSDLTKFIKMQWKIYKDNPNWVLPLIMDRKKLLNKKKNPFFLHSEMEMFLAYRDDEIVGRIAAIKNDIHNEVHKDKVGFWGFFESINSQEVANALFDSAKNWLKSKGLEWMKGPANPSSNDEYGMLVSGFDDPPRILMTYNPEYYLELCNNYGFQKEMDLFAWKVTEENVLKSDKIFRGQELIRKRYNVKARTFNMKSFETEIAKVKEIYNKAWEPNWGFVPLTELEKDALASDLKKIGDPNLAIFAEIDNKPIGFALALPDYNFIFKEINGRLFPFNFLKFYLKRKSLKWARIILLGVIPEYQRKGIDSLLYYELFKNGTKRGINLGEASWVLETNDMMNRAIESFKGEKYKTYRIYTKKI